MDIYDFLIVFAILFLLVYCSRTLAMFSASVMPTFQLSCFFAQTFFSMYIMSAGFFINLDNIFDGKSEEISNWKVEYLYMHLYQFMEDINVNVALEKILEAKWVLGDI